MLSPALFLWIFLLALSSVIPEAAFAAEFNILNHPDLRQDIFVKEDYHYLNVSKVGTFTVYGMFDCTFECVGNPFCFSVNVAASKGADEKLLCELLSSEKCSNPEEYKGNKSWHHFFIKTPCMSSPCQNGGTCVTNYKYYTFYCRCREGFIGEYCEIAGNSCKDLYHANKTSGSQVVTLNFDSKPTSVLCHIGDFGCGDGGWTPVIKMDGNKSTFHYNSMLWSNEETFNLAGGKTGFDTQETKLPTYWKTPFSKICLGMKIGHHIKFIVITKQANSLYSLIADMQYRATPLGRDTWKELIGCVASLQTNCSKEGFNVMSGYNLSSKARIGILGNNEGDCFTCDSRIGFGTGGKHDDSNVCGNEATIKADNGDKHIKGMGYILVQ